MLRRWDATYPINPWNPDGFTTYYGGMGYYGYSYGISYAVSQGSVIDTMRSSGVPSSVSTYLLCGSARDIPLWNNESDGPSDETILLASCLSGGGIGSVVDNQTIDVNHLELTYDATSVSQAIAWLG
jgi:hypothetical protein